MAVADARSVAYASGTTGKGPQVIYVEKARNRIHLRSGMPTPGLHRTVPGASFNKGTVRSGGPYWSMPLTMDACKSLRERFQDLLEIGPELWAWAKQERAVRAHMATLSTATDAVLLRVPEHAPQLAGAMSARTYQRVAARFIADGENVLLGDEPGLGKTLEALAGVVERGMPGPHLIIAPKTAVKSVWAREIPRWVPGARVLTLPDGKAKRDELLDWLEYGSEVYDGQPMEDTMAAMDRHHADLSNTWLVVNPEACRAKVWWHCKVCGVDTLRKAGKKALSCDHDPSKASTVNEYTFPQLFRPVWGAIICDESDRSLLRQTGNVTQTRQGMELIRDEGSRPEDGIRMALSGTPFRGRPHLLWGTLNWLWPEKYPAFWSWAQSHWEVDQNGYGGAYTIGKLRGDREQALWDSLTPILLRRTKEEVAPDMPPKTYVGTPVTGAGKRGKKKAAPAPAPGVAPGVWLEMLPAQAKAYREMLETSVAQVEGGDLSAVGVLAEMTRLKQFASTAGKMVEVSAQVVCKSPHCPQQFKQKTHRHAETKMVFRPALPSNKFEYLKDKLHEWGFPDDPYTKVVVVSQFTQTLELFAAELARKAPSWPGVPSVMLTGSVTGKAREDTIARFNTEEGPHLMFLNTKAGGVAITLDTADIMVILDETWIPDDQEQVENRIHRVSRPRPVEYHYLRSLDSIEEGIALVNAEREYDTKRLLDERRGIKYAKRVMKKTKGL